VAALNFFDEIDIKESADPLFTEIYHDLQGKSSPLELLSSYLDEIKGTLKNNPHTHAKLAKLFENGKSVENVEGHFYGVTIGLRTGILKRYNILNFLWGKLLADAPPWVGKGFNPVGNIINGINYFRIDEIVEVAPGLYLGQLLFATKRLFEEYNPELQSGEYRYVHFGYFLLMDEGWDAERRRLFPYTEDLWKTKASSIQWTKNAKFTNFTFAEPSDGNCSENLLKEVMRDMEGKETVLDLLKFYSVKIGKDADINSPY